MPIKILSVGITPIMIFSSTLLKFHLVGITPFRIFSSTLLKFHPVGISSSDNLSSSPCLLKFYLLELHHSGFCPIPLPIKILPVRITTS